MRIAEPGSVTLNRHEGGARLFVVPVDAGQWFVVRAGVNEHFPADFAPHARALRPPEEELVQWRSL